LEAKHVAGKLKPSEEIGLSLPNNIFEFVSHIIITRWYSIWR